MIFQVLFYGKVWSLTKHSHILEDSPEAQIYRIAIKKKIKQTLRQDNSNNSSHLFLNFNLQKINARLFLNDLTYLPE